MNVEQINTTALAYIGDSVYEVAVREYLISTGQTNVDKLHGLAVRFVRAEGQAAAIKRLSEELSDEENALVRRARNRKIASKPRNVDPVIYKFATGFEALIGYFYLSGKKERLDWFIGRAIEVISDSGVDDVKR